MKANKSVLSALLGVALLAVPITASAHSRDNNRNRGPVPAYHKIPVVAPRANFGPNLAPRVAANNRLWTAPIAPIASAREHDDWRYRDGDDHHPVDRDDYRIAPPYNPYQNSYRQGYYPEAYNSAPQYDRAPVGGGLANLIRERDNAQILYQQAVRNGNRVRAKHLLNDIIALNKRIASARG